MVRVKMTYQGELRTQATHEPSGTKLITDAPVDNQGKGESFSPTDLVATALGSCMATIMGIVARREEISLRGMEIHVDKHMTQEGPRRIKALEVKVEVPHSVETEDQKKLEQAALTCPVAQSISPKIKIKTKFYWKRPVRP